MAQFAGDAAPVVALMVNPHNDPHDDRLFEVITDEDEAELLARIAVDQDEGEDGETINDPPPLPPEVMAVRQHWRKIRIEVMRAMRAVKRTTDELRFMIVTQVDVGGDIPDDVAEVWGWTAELDGHDGTPVDFIVEKLEGMSADELGQLLMAFHLDMSCLHDNDERLSLAATYGVDVVALAAEPDPDDDEDDEPNKLVVQPSAATQGDTTMALDLGEPDQPQASAKPLARPGSVKYRNAETGETWSGRGLQPKWIQVAIASGKTLADFAVEVAEAA
jgi:DNA-binding protein H-NS